MDEWKAYLFKGQEITHTQTGKDAEIKILIK